MTLVQVLAILVAITFAVGVPAMLVWSIVDHHRHSGSRRRGSGSMTGGIGAAMQELDRLMARPSAEYTVEVQHPVVKREDDKGED